MICCGRGLTEATCENCGQGICSECRVGNKCQECANQGSKRIIEIAFAPMVGKRPTKIRD